MSIIEYVFDRPAFIMGKKVVVKVEMRRFDCKSAKSIQRFASIVEGGFF